MYKLFLCLRYLRRRYLALVAVAAVALCVAMVLIVVSVMDGFLRKVETAARGLCGDVVVDAAGISGIEHYDEFIAYLKREVPEIEAATPVIYAYGLLRYGVSTNYVQICGIHLPERLAVTALQKDMFVQTGRPDASFDPPIEHLIERTERHMKLIEKVRRREESLPEKKRDERLLGNLTGAYKIAARQREKLVNITIRRQILERMRRELQAEQARPADRRDKEKIRLLGEQIEEWAGKIDRDFRPPAKRMILGLGLMNASFRTHSGETIRLVTPGKRVVLTLLPLGQGSSLTITPNTATFTVIDDAKTDVYLIDSLTVYVPFETLQELMDMGAKYPPDDPAKDTTPGKVAPPAKVAIPPSCSQIQIKVKPPYASDKQLIDVRRKVDAAWEKFADTPPYTARTPVVVQTWREKQAKYIGAIEKQRTLVTIMFGVISLVSVLMVFAIFHMIVTQKIRDIGVVRAVGGSAGGVAQIFLGFGAATALLGSAVGLLGGFLFVHYINEIQDWLADWFGFRVWERDVFLFEKIPNTVDPLTMLWIALGAISAGLVGVLLPAIMAARMQPVEALRYE